MATKRRSKRPDGSGAMVVQPYARTQGQWTPTLIRQAELSVQNGDLRLAAQLCEWLLGDERIAQGLHTRAQALLGLDPTFEPSGDKRRSSRVVMALEGSEDWWDGWPEPQLTELVVWGILLGVGFGRHRWEELPGHGGRTLPRPVIWEAQHVRYDFAHRTWVARVVTEGTGFSSGTDEEFEPGDGTWIVHQPYGAVRPWMRGLWRGLARWRLLRDYAITDLGRLGEGVQRNVVEADKDTPQTKEVREELASDLSNMGRDGTIVLPSGFSYKLVAAGQGAGGIFETQIKLAERAIDISIRGGNLTTNVEGGSRAAAEVQERRGDQANLKFDAQALTSTVHDQSMVWWAQFNFGSAELAPWPVYPVEEEQDVKTKTEGEEKAFVVLEAAERLGFQVDRQEFLDEHGIAWAKPGAKPAAPKPVTAPPSDANPEGEQTPVAPPPN